MEFSEKLQQLRKQKNLTQEELAEALFVSRSAISKWESGRGYPGIDSLKAVSKLFAVSIDDLLCGEELILIAETESREKARDLRDLVYGALDCLVATLFFLPIFGQRQGDAVVSVSLFTLTDGIPYLQIAYVLLLSLTVVFGVTELALQNLTNRAWLKSKLSVSLAASVLATLLFIASAQPYAATLVFLILVIKGVLLLKQR